MSSNHAPSPTDTRSRIFSTLEAHASRVIVAAVVITGVLVVPFLALAPDESASTEPGGDVFTARDLVDDEFASTVYPIFFIIEDEAGNMADAQSLSALLTAQDRLRSDPDLGPTMFEYFDAETRRDVDGVLSLADLVETELRADGVAGVDAASDAQISAAIDDLVAEFGQRSELLGLSAQSERGPDGLWTVPAVTVNVLADDNVLGFGAVSVNLGGDTEPEEYSRDVQEVIRSVDGFQVNGIAIDVNLTSQEQGAVAGPFIGFTILAILVLVGLTFRSYWILAVVSAAFLGLIVWLKGISNLIGLEDDLVLSLIVPVAMISFGVDSAFHAIGRYREERAEGRGPRAAYVVGGASVVSALFLAFASDSVAFLANLTSDIESVDQFGLGAAIALGSAFLLLGIVTPLVISRIEDAVPAPAPGRRSMFARLGAGFGAAGLAMASVLLMVFILPWLGVILAAVTIIVTLVVPYLVQRRKDGEPIVVSASPDDVEQRMADSVGRAISAPTRRPIAVVAGAVAVSIIAAVFAVRVPAEFDVEDFFSTDTDFVIGLEQVDTHVADRGGEPALLYVEGDITDPEAVAAIGASVNEITALDLDSLARDDAGDVRVDGGIFEVLDATWESPAMAGLVAQQTGIEITDVDGDAIPDTRDQLAAVLEVASTVGVPLDADRLIMTPDDVTTSVAVGAERSATVFSLFLVDSRTQESVAEAAAALTPIADELSAELGDSFVQVTGSPFVREASLEATNDALRVSLAIAVLLCLLVATAFLRSVRYGLASVVPILMVVSWLYATMYFAGFSINLVTATIAAVSVGVGIDFAIHFIVRYREELDRRGQRSAAVRVAGEGTGLALVASAVSSAVGFGILALAPMPLFAAYGLLTMLMILMALAATLLVLPSLLVLVTADTPGGPTPVDTASVEASVQVDNRV